MNIELLLEKNDRKFLLQSIKVCRVIDQYTIMLGLDSQEVSAFKNDVEVFLFVANRYDSFVESFILYNIESMRERLFRLLIQCRKSVNYNPNIGEELGIPAPVQSAHIIKYPENNIFHTFLIKPTYK